jgi:hypothetical protein
LHRNGFFKHLVKNTEKNSTWQQILLDFLAT